MRKAILATLAAAAALATIATPAMAWELLGTRGVRDAVDHDAIVLPATASSNGSGFASMAGRSISSTVSRCGSPS